MIPRLQSEDKDGVITELAMKMGAEGFVDDADKLLEEALRREAIFSTAVEHGLAFPHVRNVEGGGLTFALGIHRKGIKFDGPGGKLTRIVFFIVIPTAASAFYLKLLAGLTETFMRAPARKALVAETEPLKLWKALVKLTRATIK
jgi:mannitol/fructose-specific phosphotransferase system IIA component (Ntr-type)